MIGKENWKGRKKVSRKEGGQQSGDAISDARVSLLQAYLGALRAQVPTEVSWPSLHEAGVRYFPTWVGIADYFEQLLSILKDEWEPALQGPGHARL